MPPRTARRVRGNLSQALRAAVACLMVGAALGVAPPAAAEKADREKNIEFQGDTGGGNADTKTGELVGHVIITQGTMTLQADRVTFKQNADNSMSATAYGNPVRFREKRDNADDYYEGYAQRIVYDGEKRFIELFDDALLKKSGDEIRSNYITYSAATEKFTAEGRPDAKPPAAGERPLGARVRGTFQPRSDDKDKPAGKDKDKAGATKDKDTTPSKGKDPAAASKDSDTPAKDSAAAKDSAVAKDKAPPAATKAVTPLTLQSSGDLAPPK
jgi:lipopolysaccharide export system protein LptA